MSTISLCMIVKNEERVLSRLLDVAGPLFDEIIIVDTGSTDRTIEIAKKYTQRVYDFEWVDDFSAARNFAFSKASCEYVMWLDADDVIKEEMLPEFLDAKDKMEGIPDVVMIPYETGFDEQGNCNFSYERERIIRRSLKLKFYGRVHEVIAPIGTIVHWDLAIQHKKEVHRYSDRNLKIYRKMEHEGIPFRTRDCYYYARELFYHSI